MKIDAKYSNRLEPNSEQYDEIFDILDKNKLNFIEATIKFDTINKTKIKYKHLSDQGKRMHLKIKTICRHCERSEAIQFGFLTKHRSELLHYVRNDDN